MAQYSIKLQGMQKMNHPNSLSSLRRKIIVKRRGNCIAQQNNKESIFTLHVTKQRNYRKKLIDIHESVPYIIHWKRKLCLIFHECNRDPCRRLNKSKNIIEHKRNRTIFKFTNRKSSLEEQGTLKIDFFKVPWEEVK